MLGAGIGPSLINVAACLRNSSIEGASFPGDAFDKECVPYKLQTRKLFAESHSDYCCKISIALINPDFGEQMAQACAIAWFRQLSTPTSKVKSEQLRTVAPWMPGL
jgi:hypothetical protein